MTVPSNARNLLGTALGNVGEANALSDQIDSNETAASASASSIAALEALDYATVPIDSATVIEVGDQVYLDTGKAKPASLVPYGASLAETQEAFHDAFVGIALNASANGETDDIRVAIRGVFTFDCASATFSVGDLVGPDDTLAADELVDQQVIAVATPNLAIGRVAVGGTSVTSVQVFVLSSLLLGGPQAIA